MKKVQTSLLGCQDHSPLGYLFERSQPVQLPRHLGTVRQSRGLACSLHAAPWNAFRLVCSCSCHGPGETKWRACLRNRHHDNAQCSTTTSAYHCRYLLPPVDRSALTLFTTLPLGRRLPPPLRILPSTRDSRLSRRLFESFRSLCWLRVSLLKPLLKAIHVCLHDERDFKDNVCLIVKFYKTCQAIS